MKKQRVVRGLAGILSKRKRKKDRGWWKWRRGIVFRAVVFLSVPLFKGTLALMTLTYSALGVRAGAQRCTVPAGLELQGVWLLTARTKPSRLLQVNLQTRWAAWSHCRSAGLKRVFKNESSEEVMNCDTMGFQNLQPQYFVMS